MSRKHVIVLTVTLSLYVLGKAYRTQIPFAFIKNSFTSFLFAPALYYTTQLTLIILKCPTYRKRSVQLYAIYIFLSIFIPEILAPLLSAKHTFDIADCLASLLGWLVVFGLEKNRFHSFLE